METSGYCTIVNLYTTVTLVDNLQPYNLSTGFGLIDKWDPNNASHINTHTRIYVHKPLFNSIH